MKVNPQCFATKVQYYFCGLTGFMKTSWSHMISSLKHVSQNKNQIHFPHVPSSSKITWLIMILCVSISNLVSSCTNLSVSYKERNSGMHTHTKVVKSYNRKRKVKPFCLLASRITLSEWDILGSFGLVLLTLKSELFWGNGRSTF